MPVQKTKKTTVDLHKSAVNVAQARRTESLKQRKQYIENLPDSPPILCLNELAQKTGLPYQLLRTIVVDEQKIPYMKVKTKYYINYTQFLSFLYELK